MKPCGRFVTICVVIVLFILSPLLFIISKALDYFEGDCYLSGHRWSLQDKVYMRPVRWCTKCGQAQVKLPKLEKVSNGGWVDQGPPFDGRNL